MRFSAAAMPSLFLSRASAVWVRRGFSASRAAWKERVEALRADVRVRREVVSWAWVVEEEVRRVAVMLALGLEIDGETEDGGRRRFRRVEGSGRVSGALVSGGW